MTQISIILVDYNSHEATKECLDSLVKIKKENFFINIIVVDNGSKKSLLLNKKYQEQNISLVRSEANLGFTGGNNLGMSHAIKNYNPDYLLLLNNDTIVDSNFLIGLYQAFQDNPKAGIAVSKIYFEKGCEFHKKSYSRSQKGKIIWYAGGSIDWLNLLAFHRGVDEYDYGQFDKPSLTEFATGCSMLIKRELIETVGILDKRYFLYLEDVDYSIRAQKKGYEIIFVPRSVVWHKNANSSEGAGALVSVYYQNRNRLLFTFKFGRLRQKLTGLSFLLSLLKSKNNTLRQAGGDFVLGKFGKQVLI